MNKLPTFKLNTILVSLLVLTTCLQVCPKLLPPSLKKSLSQNNAFNILEKRTPVVFFSAIATRFASVKAAFTTKKLAVQTYFAKKAARTADNKATSTLGSLRGAEIKHQMASDMNGAAKLLDTTPSTKALKADLAAKEKSASAALTRARKKDLAAQEEYLAAKSKLGSLWAAQAAHAAKIGTKPKTTITGSSESSTFNTGFTPPTAKTGVMTPGTEPVAKTGLLANAWEKTKNVGSAINKHKIEIAIVGLGVGSIPLVNMATADKKPEEHKMPDMPPPPGAQQAVAPNAAADRNALQGEFDLASHMAGTV